MSGCRFVLTISLFIPVPRNLYYTLQEGNSQGRPGKIISAVCKLEQVTISTIANSVWESPNVVAYIEMFTELNECYGNSFTEIEETSRKWCLLPETLYQQADKKADVVF